MQRSFLLAIFFSIKSRSSCYIKAFMSNNIKVGLNLPHLLQKQPYKSRKRSLTLPRDFKNADAFLKPLR